MSSNTARVKFSISEGLIEIEGSEEFVAKQLIFFEPMVTKILSKNAMLPAKNNSPLNLPPDTQSGNPALVDFENVFAINDGKVQLLTDLPGSTKAKKILNAALLLAFANDLIGVKNTTYDAIRVMCTAHACNDSTNFSTILKGAKAFFIVSGSTGSQSVSLTVPGKKKALEVANSLKT